MKVTVDFREPESIKAALARVPECEVDTAELPTGDFLVAPNAAMERKTSADLVSSILDGRFIAQARLLSDAYEKSFWIIEGDKSTFQSAIKPEALVGAVSYVGAILGSSVLYTADSTQTALLVATVARHLQEGLGYVPNLRPGKLKDPCGAAEFVIGGLPGIGGSKARQLLEKFGSVGAVFNATEADLASVKGITPRIAAQIRQVIDARCV